MALLVAAVSPKNRARSLPLTVAAAYLARNIVLVLALVLVLRSLLVKASCDARRHMNEARLASGFIHPNKRKPRTRTRTRLKSEFKKQTKDYFFPGWRERSAALS